MKRLCIILALVFGVTGVVTELVRIIILSRITTAGSLHRLFVTGLVLIILSGLCGIAAYIIHKSKSEQEPLHRTTRMSWAQPEPAVDGAIPAIEDESLTTAEEVTSDEQVEPGGENEARNEVEEQAASDDDDSGDEEKPVDAAKRIAGQTWTLVNVYASLFTTGYWWLLLCLQNSTGEREMLEVSESHDFDHFFFLREGQEVKFIFSEQNLNTEDLDNEDITDYLRVDETKAEEESTPET